MPFAILINYIREIGKIIISNCIRGPVTRSIDISCPAVELEAEVAAPEERSLSVAHASTFTLYHSCLEDRKRWQTRTIF